MHKKILLQNSDLFDLCFIYDFDCFIYNLIRCVNELVLFSIFFFFVFLYFFFFLWVFNINRYLKGMGGEGGR